MAAMSDCDDVSGKNSRWYNLILVAQLLSEGKAELEELVSQSKKSSNLALDLGFLVKRKRSPRNHNNPIKKRKRSWFLGGTSSDRSPNSILERSPVFEKPIKKQSGAFDSNQDISIKNPRGGVIIPATCSDRSPNSILEKSPVFEKPIKKQSGAFDRNLDISINMPRGSLIIPATSSDRSPNSILERSPVFEKPIKKQSGANSNSACLKKSSKSNPRLLVDQHIINDIQNPQPSLPEAIRCRIVETRGCLESAVVIIEKALYPTDVNPGQCRLSVPVRQVRERFLLAGEVDTMLGSEEGGNIGTTLIEPCLDERQITFGLWKSNKMYVLKGWNDILKKNVSLTAGTVIRLWAFRRNSKLCFALETRPNEPIV